MTTSKLEGAYRPPVPSRVIFGPGKVSQLQEELPASRRPQPVQDSRQCGNNGFLSDQRRIATRRGFALGLRRR